MRVLHWRPRLDLRPAAREVVPCSAPVPPPGSPRLAALAAAAFALAGCRLNLNAPGSTAPGSGNSAPARAAAQSGPLFTEPGAGFSPVYRLLGHARHYIDMTMYEFSDAVGRA